MYNTRIPAALLLAFFVQLHYSYSQPNCSNFEPFTFGVIADCQCGSPSCNSQFMLQDAVDYFNNNSTISFCAHLGDFWQTNYSSRSIVQPIYESLNADHHYTIGNHEFDDNGAAGGLSQAMQMNLPNILGMPDWYYDFSVYNWRFIMIESYELSTGSALAHPEKAQERDSLLNEYPGPGNAGCLSQEQLDYIESTIATAHTNNENVVLFGHHPLVHTDAHRQVRNAQSLIDILESYDNVVAYMNGHAHASQYNQLNGIHYVTFNDMLASTPATFSIVEVKYDTLEVTGFGIENDHTLEFTSKIQILDDDGDNVCNDVDVCPGFDDNLIGMPCDDNDVCTTGESFDTSCNCSGGIFQDQDNDGVCDADDTCPSFDNNLIGMPCDDNNVCTNGEIFDTNCNCSNGVFQDQDNDGVCDANDVCPSFDDNLIGMPCNDNDNCTDGETFDSNCNCSGGIFQDQDNDGVCDADDMCPSFDNDLIGLSCDDNNPCTGGETYDTNCNCSGGIFEDEDNDGVCDADDMCPSFDNNLIGMPCDDNDVCTIGETWDTNCTCSNGVFQDQDGDGVCDANDNNCISLHTDNFESNAGIWQTGGGDAHYINSNFSPNGNYSMRIRDNSFEMSSIISNQIDFSSNTDIVNVRFAYQAVGMEADKSFLLEMSNDGGSAFDTIQEWVSGIDFVNHTIYFETVQLPQPTNSATTVFRFQCVGTINSDEVYLDNIIIETCALECEDYVFDLMNANAIESRISRIGIESNHIIQASDDIEYDAGEYILLREGFEVKFQGVFHAFIEGCQ